MISVVSPVPWVAVRQLHGSRWWLLLADYVLSVRIDGAEHVLTIPAGYRYDRGSVPDAVAWIVSKDDLGCAGPLVHDALYGYDGKPQEAAPKVFLDGGQQQPRPQPWCEPWRHWTRAEADELFYQVMIADKVSPWRAKLAYWAVRLFARRW